VSGLRSVGRLWVAGRPEPTQTLPSGEPLLCRIVRLDVGWYIMDKLMLPIS
jgi:hypothetical protein